MKGVTRSVLVPAVLLLLVGTAQAQWPLGKDLSVQQGKSTEASPYVTTTGRFQIFVSPQARDFTFMLDTDTGKVWIMKKDSTTGDFSLQRVPVAEVDAQPTGKSETKQTKNSDKSSTGKK
jgi:hypothetical protein